MLRLCALLLLLTSGCAGSVSVVPVGNDLGSTGPRHAGEPGVHFFAPAPYALITTATPTGAAGPTTVIEIVYLPDPSHEYLAQWNSGLFGTINPNFTLDKGWNLVGFNTTVNTGMSASLALQGQGTATKTALRAEGAPPPAALPPGLYKLVYDASQGMWKLGKNVLPSAKHGD
jgi:hypothetical protein